MQRITMKLLPNYKKPTIKFWNSNNENMGVNVLIDTGAHIPIMFFPKEIMTELGAVPVNNLNNMNILGIEGEVSGTIYRFGDFCFQDIYNSKNKMTFIDTHVFVPDELPVLKDIDGNIILDKNGDAILATTPILVPATMFYGTKYDFDTIKNEFIINIPENIPRKRTFSLCLNENGKIYPVVDNVLLQIDSYSNKSELKKISNSQSFEDIKDIIIKNRTNYNDEEETLDEHEDR